MFGGRQLRRPPDSLLRLAIALFLLAPFWVNVQAAMAQQSIVPKALTNTTPATRDAANVSTGSAPNATTPSAPVTPSTVGASPQTPAPTATYQPTGSAIPAPTATGSGNSWSSPMAPGVSTAPGQPVLREQIDQNGSAAAAVQGSSVESYFDMRATTMKPREYPLSAAAARNASAQNEKKASAGRLLWHVFDNLGVPVKTDREPFVDPSLVDSPTGVVAPVVPKEKELLSQRRSAAAQGSPDPAQTKAITGQPFQKIPESELEGVTLPALRDDAKVGP
jgi:hypothetical protein